MDQIARFAKNLRRRTASFEPSRMVYPLQFEPIFRRYLWGGRRLGLQLHKPIGPEPDYAESWEIVDHGSDQSRVLTGPWAGRTLHDLLEQFALPLLGEAWAAQVHAEHRPPQLRGRFPLLLKFLDAHQALSVQVHPNDEQAARQQPPDLGKTEAWYVLDAEPGSRIYAGLRPGVERSDLEDALRAGTVESLMHSFAPRGGDCIFIPAGTVHAIGAGVLICEIQQASDTTYRLFDWNRLDATGKSRPLHRAESLAVIDFARGPVEPLRRVLSENMWTPFVESEYFGLAAWRLTRSQTLGGDGRLRIVVAVDGVLVLHGPKLSPVRLAAGQTALLPAALPAISVGPEPAGTLLVIDLPARS